MVGQTKGPPRPSPGAPAENAPGEHSPVEAKAKKQQKMTSMKPNTRVAEPKTLDPKRTDNHPNFMSMQQKISEKLLANQVPVQRLGEQVILKHVGSLPENKQNYITMLASKPQSNYVNYVPLTTNQQNFIAVDSQPKNFVVAMPPKPASPSSAYLLGNGENLKFSNSFVTVTTKPGETNGTAYFTMPQAKPTTYLMAKQPENSRTFLALQGSKGGESNSTATIITMESKSDIFMLPQTSQQLFHLEYADSETSGKSLAANGKFYARDNTIVHSAVPKMSCSATGNVSPVSSTKTVLTTAPPPLASVGGTLAAPRRPAGPPGPPCQNKATLSPTKVSVPPMTTPTNVSFISSSGNVTFLSSPHVQSPAGSNIATVVTSSSGQAPPRWQAADESRPDTVQKERKESNIAAPPVGLVNTVLSVNMPHSHQYLIPNVDNLKLAQESINKMVQPPPAPRPVLKPQQADPQHNYFKNEPSSYGNHLKQEIPRRKYESKPLSKAVAKYSQNIHLHPNQRSDQNQNYGSFKSRVAENRPTNHQRIEGRRSDGLKEGEDTTKTNVDSEEEEAVELRPVFDMTIPVSFQVVLIDHNYATPTLLSSTEKPAAEEEDKESVISSDGKGDEGEETETAAEGEDNITRCICGMEHDDGYMVSCDKCYVWQHVACMFPELRPGFLLPDEYLCDICRPRKLDRNRARALQLQQRKQIFARSESSDSSGSGADAAPRLPKKPVARRRAEPVARKPGKVNKESTMSHGDEPEPRRSKPHALKVGRRRASPPPPPPPPPPVTMSAIGRKTKLKKKFEAKTRALRGKNKLKELNTSAEKERTGVVSRELREEGRLMSPDARVRLQLLKCTNPSDHVSPKTVAKVRCRVSRLPQGDPILVASCPLSPGHIIVEVRGNLSLYTDHPAKSDSILMYKFPKDGSEVLIDGSDKDDVLRFARRSCRSNAQIKHYVIKGTLRLYLVARTEVEKNQELTISRDYVPDTMSSGSSQRDVCMCKNRDCKYDTQSTITPVPTAVVPPERRRRGRRRTASEESYDSSPVKPSVPPKRQSHMTQHQPSSTDREREQSVERRVKSTEPPRRHSSVTQSSRSPASPVLSDPPATPTKDKDRKLTRDERKIEQAMKIFAQMERDTARKKDKDRPSLLPIGGREGNGNRGAREEPPLRKMSTRDMDSDKESAAESGKPRRRRRRKRRRSVSLGISRSGRKVRLLSGASSSAQAQLNSCDSDVSSGEEIMSPRRKRISKDSGDELHSPIEKMTSPLRRSPSICTRMSRRDSMAKGEADDMDIATSLLSLGNGRNLSYGVVSQGQKTPTRCDKESEGEMGSPPTPLSSACLLVAAAVGPLAPEFRFPKTKKGLMNEWLGKSPEHQSVLTDFSPSSEIPPSMPPLPPGAPKLSNLSNRLFSLPVDIKPDALPREKVDSLIFDGKLPSGTPAGFGKKRWLRQAISEETETPQGQCSPPCPPDNVTPLKKRRLARESLSSDPPTTPPAMHTGHTKDDHIHRADTNSPESPTMIDAESEISLAERVDALRRELLDVPEHHLADSKYDTPPQNVPENLSFQGEREEELSNDEVDNEIEKESEATPLDLTGQSSVIVMAESKRKGKGKKNFPRAAARRGVKQRKAILKECKPVTENKVEVISFAKKEESVTDNRFESLKSEEDSGLGLKTNDESKDSVDGEQVDLEMSAVDAVKEGIKDVTIKKEEDVVEGEEVVKLKEEVRVKTEEERTIGEDNVLAVLLKEEQFEEDKKPDYVKDENEQETSAREVIGLETEEERGEAFGEQTELWDEGQSTLRESCEEGQFMLGEQAETCEDGQSTLREQTEVCEDGQSTLREQIESCEDGQSTLREQTELFEDGQSTVKEPAEACEDGQSTLREQTELCEEGQSTLKEPAEACEDGQSTLREQAREQSAIKRKLSITEYLKRKKSVLPRDGRREELLAPPTPPKPSPPSDEERSILTLPSLTLQPIFFDQPIGKPGGGCAFKSEPTELERQRENLTERLRREFGLMISDDEPPRPPLPAEEPPSEEVYEEEDDMPPPPPPPMAPPPVYHHPYNNQEANGLKQQSLPQSVIYPVGSSNPPNPSPSPYLPPPAPRRDRDRKLKKLRNK